MSKTCLQIQNHAKYLLTELDKPKRKERIENSEFYNYFKSVEAILHNIVDLSETDLTLANLTSYVVPLLYRNNYTEQGVINAFYEIEIRFWSVIRYCENFSKENTWVRKLKNLIIQTTDRIINEMSDQELIKSNINILTAIRNWNFEYQEIKSMFTIKNDRYDIKKPHQHLQLMFKEKYREVDPFLFILNYFFSLCICQKIKIPPRIKHDLTLLTIFNLMRTQDSDTSFISTPRQREMFSYGNLNEVINKIKKINVKRILDLFANVGFTSLIGFLYDKTYIQINDMSYSKKQSLANLFMEDVQLLFDSNFYNGSNVDLAFERLETSSDYKKRKQQLEIDRYTSNKPYLPVSSVSVSPKAIFAMTGPFISIAEEYDKVVNVSNIKISKETSEKDFSTNKFDLIIIDPPFGIVSKYQVTENQGRKLLEISIGLASKLINKKGFIIFRMNKNWKLPRIPDNWKLEVKIGGKLNPKFFCFKLE